MKNTNTKRTDNSTILPYQRPVFDQLCAVAKACIYTDRSQFKIKPRCCFLLIGPTGTGKTHLSETVANEIDTPFFSISVSDWIILGNSNGGSNNTWPLLIKFILKNIKKQGAIIFVDELDKCRGDTDWNTYVRTEIFSLCDARVPAGIKDSDSSSKSYCDDVISEVEDFIKNKTMIIAGSAFQEIWEKSSTSNIGFNNSTASPGSGPKLSDLTATLPRELINRFSSTMFILPQLRKQDYRDMITAMSKYVSDTWIKRFISIGLANLDKAVRDQKGARYVEETMLSAIVEERAYLIESCPNKNTEHTDEIEFKHDDEIHLF